MKSCILKNLFSKNILCGCILGIVSGNFGVFDANALITTRAKINREINAAVDKERRTWQARVSEKENAIRNLQNSLNSVQANLQRTSNEKAQVREFFQKLKIWS